MNHLITMNHIIDNHDVQLLFGDIIYDVIQYEKYTNTCYNDLFDDLRYITYVHYIVRILNKYSKYKLTVSELKSIAIPHGKLWYEQMYNSTDTINPINHKLLFEIYDRFKDKLGTDFLKNT